MHQQIFLLMQQPPFLKIIHYPADSFRIQHLTFLIPDGIDPAADIQHGWSVGGDDAGPWIGILHDVFQNFPFGSNIQG